jgi:uncharacterized protein (TIGR00255 family)
MISSMTGFAREEQQSEQASFSWELRSINHRFLEISLRLPEELRPLEPLVRERIGQQIRRGKVEAQLRYRGDGQNAGAGLNVNAVLASQVIDAAQALPISAATGLDPLAVLRWPGVVIEPEQDLEVLREPLLALLEQALQGLSKNRQAEGERIQQMLQERQRGIMEWIMQVRGRLPQVQEVLRERMQQRLLELQANVDPDRLLQEIALLIQKMDVAEELDRLQSHLTEFEATLARAEPVGRRLDFLLQEFNREANTLASKSQDAQVTRAAVEIKVLIEQLREQVQNIE